MKMLLPSCLFAVRPTRDSNCQRMIPPMYNYASRQNVEAITETLFAMKVPADRNIQSWPTMLPALLVYRSERCEMPVVIKLLMHYAARLHFHDQIPNNGRHNTDQDYPIRAAHERTMST